MFKRTSLFLTTIFVLVSSAFSQCLQIADGNGVMTDNPVFVNCAPGTFTIFIQPDRNMGAYTISWGDGSPNSTGASLVPPAFVSHAYAATTDTFTLTVTDNSTACTITGLVVMERNPLASIQLPAGDDNFGCTPIQFRFINSSTQISQTTVFEWDFGDGTPIETYDYTNLGDTVYHTYQPGIGALSCDIEVRLTATNYCGSSTASFFPLKVWDLDEAVITPSATLLCYPDTVVQYTNNTIRNCFPEGNQSQRYEKWNFGDYWGLGYDSIIDWRPWNPPITPPPPIGYPGIGTYTATLIDSSYCGLDTTAVTIQITGPPTAVLTANKDTICEGENVTFSNASVGGANEFRWDFDLGAGFQTLNGGNKTRTYNNSGDYTIRLAVGIAGAQGCADTTSIDLHVLPSPTADFSFDTNNECDSMLVNFSDLSSGSIATYAWDFDNGNTFNGPNPPAQNYTSPGTYSITLTVTSNRGCSNTISRNIRVRETPQAGFSVASVCLNQLANFIDQSVSSIDPVTSYKWYFGDGDSSSLQDPSHLYTSFGSYQVVQIVDNGFCQDSDTLNVVVENTPSAAFTADTLEGCSQLRVNFTNQSSVNAVSFRWNFGDGSAIVNARDTFHTFTNNSSHDTNFVVQLIARTAFGCADTSYDTVTVYPVPIPLFTSNAVADCAPSPVDFTNNTVGDSLSFRWDFGDGSPIVNDTNPTHLFQNNTLFISNYRVLLSVTSNNGCASSDSAVVTVYPEPNFTFVTNPDTGCSPLNVTFPSVVGAVDYQWDFGDGATASGPTPSHVYVNNTTNNQVFQVRLIAQNGFGCRDTTFGDVLVYPNPTSVFTLDTNKGCQPLAITINNNSLGANSYSWSFGDGSSSDTTVNQFVKTFVNTSALTDFNTIRLITETVNGCKDTASATVEVHPFIRSGFTSDTVGCSPMPVSFINQSQGAAAYQWNFGDGATSPVTNPNHLYTNTSNSNQSFTARLIATSAQSCADTTIKNILIYPKPDAQYTVSSNSGCHPLTVTFTNNSTLADSCVWTYGDQASFFQCTPTNTHTYTNTTSFTPVNYNSRLIVLTDNGCRDTMQEVIRVNPQVIASFSADTIGCSPLNVRFRDQSTGGQTFQWDFGDGSNSIQQNPNHTFINSGIADTTFTASLLTTSQYNCSSSINLDITVHPKPSADFVMDVNDGCHPLDVTFTNQSIIADSCTWTYGDGNNLIACTNLTNHTYTNTVSFVPINYQPRLIVNTVNGCADTLSRSVSVKPQVLADFTSDTIGCSPLRINFRNQSTGGQTFQWTFGDGGGSPLQNPEHFFINPGSRDTVFTTTLLTTSQYNCSSSITQDITVFAKPIADFIMDINDGCQPLEVTFTNQSSIADSCSWNYGDGNNLIDCSILSSHTYTNTLSLVPITFNPRLIVNTDNGCADTLSKNVSVKPQVVADFTGPDTACSPLDAEFRSQSFGAVAYRWDFGDGRLGSGMITSNRYTNTGSIDVPYTVRLIAESLYGCDDTLEKVVLVRPTPVPDFDATPNFQVFPNSTVTLSNNTNAGNWSYFWDFDDTSSATVRDPAPHTYQTWGQYIIKLIASSPFCSDSISKLVEVDVPVPIADFSDSISGCQPLEVSFTNESIYGRTYEWDFGDGGRSSAENPRHIYFNEGVYNVTLTVTGFAPNKQHDTTKFNYVRVFKSPQASYVISSDEVFIPNDPVVFSNQSLFADSYLWDFGDGNSSTERSPVYNYTEEGEYQTSLIVYTTDGNCTDTFRIPTLVNARLEGRVEVPNAFTPNRNGSNGGTVDPNPGAGQFNDVFYAKISGSTKYELNIFNKWGELLFVSKDINVGWDGYYKGELCKQDVYVWKVKAEFADGTSIVKVGDLMLLR
jgi:PKD repeat protein